MQNERLGMLQLLSKLMGVLYQVLTLALMTSHLHYPDTMFSFPTDDDDSDAGPSSKPEPEEMEFEDEEQHATVTVVEDFDVDVLGEYRPSRPIAGPDDEDDNNSKPSTSTLPKTSKAPSRRTSSFTLPSKSNTSSTKPSTPKKKGRPSYLTKAERRLDKLKQKAKRSEKAEDEKIKRKMSGAVGGRKAKVSRGKKGQRGPGHLKKTTKSRS